jgi:DNA-binding transcriptional LysR family regulator
MDELTALRVFRAIVDEGSFAAAARRLRLSPAAVSKNVAELEQSLGSRLLNRTTRKLSLTDAGEIYIERISSILDELEEANRSVGRITGAISGRLRVSAPLTLGLVALTQAISSFLEQHPQLTLELDLDDRRVDMIREGFDLALRGGPALEDSSLIARKVTSIDYVLCASPEYLRRRGIPGSPGALRDHELVRFSVPERDGSWNFEQSGTRLAVPLQARYHVNSSLAVRDAVKSGFGIGRIPKLYIRDELRAGTLVEVMSDWSTGTLDIFAVYPSRRYVPPKTIAFIDFVRAVFDDRD